MSTKKKSLGSSPIGYSSLGVDSFEFIPSIEVSSDTYDHEEKSRENNDPFETRNGHNKTTPSEVSKASDKKNSNVEKKIVSYYLEETLINRLKRVADEHKIFYSTLVSNAISCWLEKNDYD